MEGSFNPLPPQYIFRQGETLRPIHEVSDVRPHSTLCYSGITSGHVRCGEFIGFRTVKLKTPGDEDHGREVGIVFKGHLNEPGDSGAPVWDAKTGEVVGIIRGDAEFEAGSNFATPLLRQPGYSAEKVAGLFNVLDAAGGTELRLERAP